MDRKKKEAVPAVDPRTVSRSFETFQWLGPWEECNIIQNEPYVWNGVASVRKYRVTVEPVEEPIEVLRQRVQELWDKCGNHHYWDAIQALADEYGMGRLERNR